VEPYGDRWVDVAVADEGAGVPMEFVPLLFERFTQAPGTSSDLRSGAGLGLSIVSGLVTAQGGSLWYEPNEPRGARFTVRLPRSTN
jgi:signal transduction histidine kinase